MMLDFISVFILFACVVIIVVGIWKIHTLPGVIAKRRNHPQAEAIEITAYLGLIAFPLWMAALIWAYVKPVMRPIEIGATAPEPPEPAPPAAPEA